LEHACGERENVFQVLTYHRISELEPHLCLDPGLISASPEAFDAQMKYLAANYEVVSMLDVIKAFENEGRVTLPPRAVTITFDDAYSDFEQYAWPVLKQYGIPVTLFVSTAFPDHPERLFWWDKVFNAIHTTQKGELNTSFGRLPISTEVQREQAYQRLKNRLKMLPSEVAMKEIGQICDELGVSLRANFVLGWASLRQLASEGVTLGAHTRTHPILNNISLDDLHNEITGSICDLQQETGLAPQVFAYPNGIQNDDAVKIVEGAGFALAFTTQPGINETKKTDRLRLHRINVGKRTTIPILRAKFLVSKFISF
jgi:peptidoglycan/xylan/chitin deacetylase (PgdA/CDA1 family)